MSRKEWFLNVEKENIHAKVSNTYYANMYIKFGDENSRTVVWNILCILILICFGQNRETEVTAFVDVKWKVH